VSLSITELESYEFYLNHSLMLDVCTKNKRYCYSCIVQ